MTNYQKLQLKALTYCECQSKVWNSINFLSYLIFPLFIATKKQAQSNWLLPSISAPERVYPAKSGGLGKKGALLDKEEGSLKDASFILPMSTGTKPSSKNPDHLRHHSSNIRKAIKSHTFKLKRLYKLQS